MRIKTGGGKYTVIYLVLNVILNLNGAFKTQRKFSQVLETIMSVKFDSNAVKALVCMGSITRHFLRGRLHFDTDSFGMGPNVTWNRVRFNSVGVKITLFLFSWV